MDNFVVSARKYRPATFGTVVGQNAITGTLKNAIRNQQLAQAFLFCGPRGVGKTTCARILAKTINCLNPSSDIEACNECESCKAFNTSSSFNIHELDAASNNSVDDIRNLVDQVRIPPQMGRYKVYIIDEVHMLSASAFNAFLKTLEEPPAYAKFILATTEKHKIIPTILSRCQIFDFKRITVDDIASHLQFVANAEQVTADPDALHFIAHKADGALRDALSVFDQMVNLGNRVITRELVVENLNILDYDYYFRLIEFVRQGNFRDSLLLLNEIIDKGFDGQHFLIGLGDHLRNLLMSIDPATVKLIETAESIRKKYAQQAQSVSMQLLITSLEIVNKNDINYRTSNHKRLSLEITLVQMCRLSGNMVMQAAPSGKDQANVQSQPISVASTAVPQSESNGTSIIKNTPEVLIPSTKAEVAPQPNVSQAEKPLISPVQQEASAHPESKIAQVVEIAATPEAQKKSVPEETKPDADEQKAVPVQAHHISSTSIKDITNAALRSKLVEEKEVEFRTEKFTLEQIQESVSRFAETNKEDSALLYAALTDFKPTLVSETVFSITVKNNVLEKELNERRNKLLEYVRNEIMNDAVTLQIAISDVQVETKKYMSDTDKFREMVDQNPNVRKITDQLNLELDI